LFFVFPLLAFGQSIEWVTSANDYEHSMSLTCVVSDQESQFSVETLSIGVFSSDNICVGVGYLDTYFSPIQANIGFVTIFSNELQNLYTIKVMVNEEIYEAGSIEFTANEILGTLMNPFVINPSYEGCTDILALNYDDNAIQDNGLCIYTIEGCTDSTMFNYNINANTDDGSCISLIIGCMDPAYLEYDPNSNSGDQAITCVTEIVYGCTNDCFTEFDIAANEDDGSCYMSWHQAYSLLLIENPSPPSSIEIELPSGWCLIGYTSSQEQPVQIGLDCIINSVIILKDYLGAVYLPDFGFNGIGNFLPGLGYQIKLEEPVDNFKFCE